MERTVKELADTYGMSKQAIKYHIDKIPEKYKSFATKNGTKILLINDEGQEFLGNLLTKKQADKKTDFNSKKAENFNTPLMDALLHQLEEKDRQLSQKDDQIKAKDEQIKGLLKSLDQAQQLQAITESKLQAIEDKHKPEPRQTKNNFWKDFFKSNNKKNTENTGAEE